jgi:hypothetical protein
VHRDPKSKSFATRVHICASGARHEDDHHTHPNSDAIPQRIEIVRFCFCISHRRFGECYRRWIVVDRGELLLVAAEKPAAAFTSVPTFR